MLFEALETRANIAWAPQSTATEQLAPLAAAPVAYYDDSAAVRGALLERRRSRASEVAALVAPLGYVDDSASGRPLSLKPLRSCAAENFAAIVVVPLGAPWDSSYPIQIAATAPPPEHIDVLLALPMLPGPGPFGEWLDSSATLYGFTPRFIPNSEVLPALVVLPPPPYFDMGESPPRQPPVPRTLMRFISAQDATPFAVWVPPQFVLAGNRRISHSAPRARTAK